MDHNHLADNIEEFLASEILSKHEDDRTKNEDLLLQAGRTLADGLRRRKSATHGDDSRIVLTRFEGELGKALKGYNEINREYDLRDADADILARARKGTR